jgi:hypothetical protein
MIDPAVVKGAVPEAASLDSGILEEMIARATAFVETQTRRYFGEKTARTVYVSGTGGRFLRLAEAFVGSPADIEERPYPGGTLTTIPIASYEVRQDGSASALVRIDGAVWARGYEYAVVVEQGYDPEEVPGDIVDVVIGLVGVKLKFQGHEGMRSESIGGYSYTRFGDDDLDAVPGAKATLAAWRRPVIA